MAVTAQLTGMTGVFLVAYELSKRGWIVTTTSRNAAQIDLLISKPNASESKTRTIQVKTNSKITSFWLTGEKSKKNDSPNLFYVLVDLDKIQNEFYIVPSQNLSQIVQYEESKTTRNPEKKEKSKWYSVYKKDVKSYRDKWELLN